MAAQGRSCPSIHQQMTDERNVIHPHNGILLSLKEGCSSDTCHDVDEPGTHHAKRKKPKKTREDGHRVAVSRCPHGADAQTENTNGWQGLGDGTGGRDPLGVTDKFRNEVLVTGAQCQIPRMPPNCTPRRG